MTGFVKRVRVLLRAAPTWLVGAAIVVSSFSEEVGSRFPGSSDEIAAVAGPVLAGIAAAVAIVRRVTPVVAAERGLLPVEPVDDAFGGGV